MNNQHELSHPLLLQEWPNIGRQTLTQLKRLDLVTVRDLLFHWPLRYQDKTKMVAMRDLQNGMEVLVEGTLLQVYSRSGRTKLVCVLADSTGHLSLRFFHVLSFQKTVLQQGARLRCFGTVRQTSDGMEMIHPELYPLSHNQPAPKLSEYLTPIYPTTAGLTQPILRKVIAQALNVMEQSPEFFDYLAELRNVCATLSLSFKEAIYAIHYPSANANCFNLLARESSAHQRLCFEELLAHRLSLLKTKKIFKVKKGIALAPSQHLQPALLKHLPFTLTLAQERVIKDIEKDLRKSRPMLRLVQGDVGSGKTLVAVMAILQAVENGYQAVMMAPTELLVEQHARNLQKWLAPLNIEIAVLTGQLKTRARKQILQKLKENEVKVIVGTHAVFQADVHFAQLVLVVVDEQHRFGVEQRALLRDKGIKKYVAHQLVLTATPIPRTLAMSFYAELDCSTIDMLPPGRTPIVTSVVPSSRRETLIAKVNKACQEGRQVYWVCPLIEESSQIPCQSASQTHAMLQDSLPQVSVGLIHGRMPSDEKTKVMDAFQKGALQVLVATTVIEVGVDVANASIMVIENAERLGLSQLHQLRGRVGRGKVASHCVLLYQEPLSRFGQERLQVLRETSDGFIVAQRDLVLRGPGEVLGTRQAGDAAFYVADLIRDQALLPQVCELAEYIHKKQKPLALSLIERWLIKNKQYVSV